MKNDAAALVGACLEKLETVVRVSTDRARLDRDLAGGPADLVITLQGEGGQAAAYAVTVKNQVSGRSAEMLLLQILDLNTNRCRSMFFAPYVPRAVAAKCKSLGIEFVDSAGNMHINLPWLKVFVSGDKPESLVTARTSLGNTASLKIIYTFLAYPAAGHWTQRDMAEAAGVALGSVGAVYKALRAQEYLHLREEHGNVVREIVKASALLERWLIGYGERLRRNLLLRAYRLVGNQSVAEIVPALENAFGGQVLVGGELGATLLEPGHLHPGAATLHLDPAVDVKKLALRLRLVPDQDGNVTLLQTFGTANALDWGQHAGVPLAHPLLLYAELLQGADPRTREFARDFYEARIKGTLP